MSTGRFELEELVQPLAAISSIIFRRLQCMECNQCEPCGETFMAALKTLSEAGKGAESREAG